MINLYWKNATDKVVGPEHGLTGEDLAAVAGPVEAAHAALMDQVRHGQPGYTALPDHPSYPSQVKQLAAQYRGNTTDLVVLGIGGSALGAIAIQNALNPATYNLISDKKRGGPRLFVLDNVDPALISDTLKFLGRRLETTLFNVISKSGETAETAAQFMIIREMLRDRLGETFASRIVATTDAQKGTLHEIAKQDGYATLPVPGDVGERFSVLSPVGLFPAAMTGVDIDAMLAGAMAMKQRLANPKWRENPACVLAAV
ncbi:MAG: glucose-6-phosphate isomerase, partial [Planctomycetota bacterium]|nr:glucose-6-phosphate isomerase [Planctomycetota bacterium]